MEHLYHLSHFFEFLCSVYFGSAILIFIEESLIKRIYNPVNEKILDINGVRVLIRDYTNMISDKPMKDVKLNQQLWVSFGYPLYHKYENTWYRKLMRRKEFIEKVNIHKDKFMILKMFFPTFFFTGVYCFLIVMLSAFQYTNNNPVCYKSVDCFLIDMSAAVLIYQCLTLIVVPRLVGKITYFLIIFAVIVLVAVGTGIVIELAVHLMYLDCKGLLQEENKSFIELMTISIALLPIGWLLLRVAYDICMYVIITGFYNLIKWAFLRSMKGQIDSDISGVQ